MPESSLRLAPWLLVLAAALTADFARGQQFAFQPVVQRSSRVASFMNSVQFRVVGGRIVTTSSHFGGGMSSESNSGATRERTSINFEAGIPTIEYQLSDKTQELKANASNGERFSLKRTAKDGSKVVPFELVQDPEQQITLTIGQGSERRIRRAPGLWHLWLAEPEFCEQQLQPLLEKFRRNWKLSDRAKEIEAGLLVAAESVKKPDRDKWQRWVGDLASEQYGVRAAADRNLRQAGPAALPFLQTLKRTDLDAEQWYRIRLIVATLADEGDEDSPARTVTYLAGDPRVWLWLLNHAEEPKRRLAAGQLAAMIDGKLEFDPAAPAAQRTAQIEKLRARIDPPVALPAE